ncbi:MAG: hypothetical protein FWG10_14195 [Eubacteriaceae bacterium]|nr:hypothetical protein [Eubacteriaceae bacterium]
MAWFSGSKERANLHAQTLNDNAQQIGKIDGKVNLLLQQQSKSEERQASQYDNFIAKIEALGEKLASLTQSSKAIDKRQDERIDALEGTAKSQGERIATLEQAPAKKLVDTKDTFVKQAVVFFAGLLLAWLAGQLGLL